MDVIAWLEQIRKLDQLIDAKIAERQRLISIAEDISAKPIDGMPHSNTGMVNKKLENAVASLVDLERETNRLIDKYVALKKEIIRTLEKLPEKEYGALHRYYIRGMSWEAVAEDMGYCTVQIWRIKNKGLEMLQKIIDERGGCECIQKKP